MTFIPVERDPKGMSHQRTRYLKSLAHSDAMSVPAAVSMSAPKSTSTPVNSSPPPPSTVMATVMAVASMVAGAVMGAVMNAIMEAASMAASIASVSYSAATRYPIGGSAPLGRLIVPHGPRSSIAGMIFA